MADVVAASDVADWFVTVTALDRFALLVRGELWFSADLHAARLRPLAAFPGAGANKITFKLCQPT